MVIRTVEAFTYYWNACSQDTGVCLRQQERLFVYLVAFSAPWDVCSFSKNTCQGHENPSGLLRSLRSLFMSVKELDACLLYHPVSDCRVRESLRFCPISIRNHPLSDCRVRESLRFCPISFAHFVMKLFFLLLLI